MSLYRPRSEWIITDNCCLHNIYFASKLQGTLTNCCYFPLYCRPFFEKCKMKSYYHKCSRVTLWHTVTTYNEILTCQSQRIDHEELSLDDAICLVALFTSCIAEPSEYFPHRFFNWMAENCVQRLPTVVCAHGCLSISVKWNYISW